MKQNLLKNSFHEEENFTDGMQNYSICLAMRSLSDVCEYSVFRCIISRRQSATSQPLRKLPKYRFRIRPAPQNHSIARLFKCASFDINDSIASHSADATSFLKLRPVPKPPYWSVPFVLTKGKWAAEPKFTFFKLKSISTGWKEQFDLSYTNINPVL